MRRLASAWRRIAAAALVVAGLHAPAGATEVPPAGGPALAAPDPGSPLPACTPRIVAASAVRTGADEAPPATGWEAVTLPDRWQTRWPEHSGAVWYRVDWTRGCPTAGPRPPVALSLDWISLAGEIFVNDGLLWRDRYLAEPYSRGWNMPRAWQLPEPMLREEANTLWIRVHGLVAQSPGLGSLRLGDPDVLQDRQATRSWHQRTAFQMNLVVSAVLGCLFFCIWLLHRPQPAHGWYALTALFWVLFCANVLAPDSRPFPDTYASARANLIAYLLFVVCHTRFSWQFCGLVLPRATRWLSLLAVLLAGATLLSPAAMLVQTLPTVGRVVGLVLIANTVYLLVHALRTRRAEHLILATSGLLFVGTGIHDALVMHEQLQHPPLTPYTSLLVLALISALLGRRIARDMRRIERFNQELGDAVDRACTDLSATLAREHALMLDNSRLQERLQLAHDLHDGLGGSLVRAIAHVEQASTPVQNGQFLSMLKLLRDDLRQVIDSGAGTGGSGARSPSEWAAPLRHRFVTLFDELDIDSRWQIPSAWRTPPGALVCLGLTRLLEEAMTNIIKHSRARHVTVALALPDDDRLVLRIEDDGIGFDVETVQRAGGGIGMRSMHVRATRLGGSLHITSRRGATVLEVRLPLTPAATAGA